MARRKSDEGILDDIFELLLVTPAWVGPVLALVVFLVLRFVVPPAIGGGEPGPGTVLASVAHRVAPWLAGAILVLWGLAEIRKLGRRELLDGQSGLDSVRALSWQEFEHLVGESFRRRGFAVEERGSAGGDGGIDLVLNKGGERTIVQCKQWRNRKVGVKPVRELYGVMVSEAATRAILVTCGSFTREASRFAEGKPLALVAGPKLWELVQSVKTARRSPPPRNTATSAASPGAREQPARLATATTPECPQCGAAMALRTAKKGPNTGSRFWGCSRFPDCRGTREYDA